MKTTGLKWLSCRSFKKPSESTKVVMDMGWITGLVGKYILFLFFNLRLRNPWIFWTSFLVLFRSLFLVHYKVVTQIRVNSTLSLQPRIWVAGAVSQGINFTVLKISTETWVTYKITQYLRTCIVWNVL